MILQDAEESDAELVNKTLAGDQRAFAVLYERHAPLLSRRLRRVLFDKQDVNDVLQQTFLEVFRNLSKYQPDKPFAAWLLGFSYRVTGHYLRSHKRRQRLRYVPGDRLEQQAVAISCPEREAATRQRIDTFYAALRTLSAKQQFALAMVELEGMTLADVGTSMGLSPKTVWAHVQRARKLIQAAVARGRKS